MSEALYASPSLGRWRDAAGADWATYTTHPFVQGLADGSLPQASFQHYLIQDYIFLVHFTRAWAMAVVKSESLAEMKIAASTVDALVNHEMQLHVETCKKIGISEQQLYGTDEALENLAYTRFVMDAGLSGDFLDLMAALAPCIFGYGVIGAQIAKSASTDTPYKDWIDTYAGDAYQDLCHRLGAMIEQAIAARLGARPSENPRWALLCKRFHTATRLEIEFWQMGLRGR
ncbi:MAG: thiaminase II [Rhodospirillales bacterium]|nr:thiaminase II [Rhodospirillales bacterium]